ncbi:MAG: FAD-dependent oxidoreductase [Chloroflexi bacterium]|nr:FAD-dependent oxidoreductase [Chloroflexota bacterium]
MTATTDPSTSSGRAGRQPLMVSLSNHHRRSPTDRLRDGLAFDVCVVGGGSGGFGAACAAARHGTRVLLVEAGPGLGGTSTWAGVNNWEPVAGPTGLPQELYQRLRRVWQAVALQQRVARYHPDRPWGWYGLARETDYRLSLSRRSGVPICFEPEALDRAMAGALAEEERCTVWLCARFVDVDVARDEHRIRAIRVETPEGSRWVTATVFVDASAGIYLAHAAGCESRIGPDTREVYDEPSAPEMPIKQLNNASLCYRIARLAPGEPRQDSRCPKALTLPRFGR